jgi:hypothetical protein
MLYRAYAQIEFLQMKHLNTKGERNKDNFPKGFLCSWALLT